jgi:hypothetical protein
VKLSLVALFAACTSLLFVGCSDEQKRDVEGAAVKVVIERQTKDVLSDNDVDLDGDLDCSADIADDASVTGTCSGVDVDGTAVETTLDGTIDLDDATCDSTLKITWGTTNLADETGFDCLDS